MLRMLLIFVLVMVTTGLWMNYFEKFEPEDSNIKITRFMPNPNSISSGYKIISVNSIDAKDLIKYKIIQAKASTIKAIKPEIVEKAIVFLDKENNVQIFVFTKNKKVFTLKISDCPENNFVFKSYKVTKSTIKSQKIKWGNGSKETGPISDYTVEMTWVRQDLSRNILSRFRLVIPIITTVLLLGLVIWSVTDFVKKLVKRRQDSPSEKSNIIEPAYSFQKKERRIRPKK